MTSVITSAEFSLPPWASEYAQGVDELAEIEERVAWVIEASRRNILEQTGGPFAAAVFESESGRLVSLGVNLVTSVGLSVLHAEIVALSLAQRRCGTWNLGAANLPSHDLVTSTEPCAMCFGAIPWSGIRRLICAARDEDARRIGFDEGPKIDHWVEALADRGIQVIADVHRDRATAVLAQYAAAGGAIYNAREHNR